MEIYNGQLDSPWSFKRLTTRYRGTINVADPPRLLYTKENIITGHDERA